MDPHFSPRSSSSKQAPQLPTTTSHQQQQQHQTTTTSTTTTTSSQSSSTFSLTTAILSFFSPSSDNKNSNNINNQANQQQQQQQQQQDWPTQGAANSIVNQQQQQQNLTSNAAINLNQNQADQNLSDLDSTASQLLNNRDSEYAQQQQQQEATLMSCVDSLFKNEATHRIVLDLLDVSHNERRASNDSSSYMNSSGGGEQPRSFSAALNTTHQFSLLNESTLINWTRLSEILPSTESNYQLEALSEKWQFYLAAVYSLTAITSFILNMITVIVLIRSRRSELRKYLINLSLSDLLMSLFSIPFTYTEYMLGHWIFASFLCPVVRLVVTLSVFVSVATMTVIGINRHLAIMYPLKRKKYSKFQSWTIRKTHVIIAIWLLGMAISLPEYLMYSTQPFCYNRQLFYECRQSWPNSMANSYTIFIYMSTFVVPFSLLTYLYTCIGFKLWRREMPGNIDVNRDLTMQTQRTKVIKMLLVVVVLFAIFWLPLQTFSLVTFLYPNLREGIGYQSLEYNIFIGTYFASHWLSMAHSCLNPLIYCFMNDKFRNDLHSLICANNKRHVSSLYNYSISRITQQSSYSKQTSSNQFMHSGSGGGGCGGLTNESGSESKCVNKHQSFNNNNNNNSNNANNEDGEDDDCGDDYDDENTTTNGCEDDLEMSINNQLNNFDDGRQRRRARGRRRRNRRTSSSSNETSSKTSSERHRYYFQSSDTQKQNHQLVEHHHHHHYHNHCNQQQQQRGRSSSLMNDGSTTTSDNSFANKANNQRSQKVEMIESAAAAVAGGGQGATRGGEMLKLADLLKVDSPAAAATTTKHHHHFMKTNGEQVFMRIIEQTEPDDDDRDGEEQVPATAQSQDRNTEIGEEADQPGEQPRQIGLIAVSNSSSPSSTTTAAPSTSVAPSVGRHNNNNRNKTTFNSNNIANV